MSDTGMTSTSSFMSTFPTLGSVRAVCASVVLITTSWLRRCRLSAGREGFAEKRDGLADRRVGGVGLAQGVEHHEVVDDALIADSGDGDVGVAQLVRVGLAFVAQDVGCGGDHERGR